MKTKMLLKVSSVLFLSSLSLQCAKEEEVLKSSEKVAAASARTSPASKGPRMTCRSGNYILISESHTLPVDLDRRVKAMKGTVTKKINSIGLATVTSKDPSFAAKCAKISGIRTVVRDFRVQFLHPEKDKLTRASKRAANPPNSGDDDFFFDLQWGLDAINAPEAWKKGYRGNGAKVAILDTGFDLDHPDLATNIDLRHSANFVPGETLEFVPSPINVSSHGTFTAGIVAAPDNGIGVIGVAPKSKLMLVKVLDDEGFGAFSWVMAGIIHAAQCGADVINMSLSGYLPLNGEFINDNGTPEDPDDDFIDYDPQGVKEIINAFKRATTYAFKRGVTTFASTGNDAVNADALKTHIILPLESPYVAGISATAPRGWAKKPSTFLDHPASYSNYGLSVVNFAAPGGDLTETVTGDCTVAQLELPCSYFDLIISTDDGGWSFAAGTSAASPYAAGVAALIIGKHKGSLSPLKVIDIMKDSAKDLGKRGKDAFYGDGRVNAFKAVTPYHHSMLASQ